MTKILHIDSSAKGEDSVTRKLTKYSIEQLKKIHSNAKVIYHDLTADSYPHINPAFIKAMFAGKSGEVSSDILLTSDKLINELQESDIIVIGAPMYNFGIPSQLKTWIDYVCRAGKTFRYTQEGPQGLLLNKKALVAISMGGNYSDGPMKAYDHVTPYMKQVLGFMGISDIVEIAAEKQNLSPDLAANEFAKAEQQINATTKNFG